MIKKRIMSFIAAVIMFLPVFPSYTKTILKANIISESSPQVTINGKQYDVTLSNCRIENGNEVYDAYIKIPDYANICSVPSTPILAKFFDNKVTADGYDDSQNVNLLYNNKNYSGSLSRQLDLADDNSPYVSTSDPKYLAGMYNGTAYAYNEKDTKDFTVNDYIYNKNMLDPSNNLLPAFSGSSVPVTATIPAESSRDSKLDLGSSIVATTPSGTTVNGIQLYKLSGQTIGGSQDLTKAFLLPTDGTYEVTCDDMIATKGSNPIIINKPSSATFNTISSGVFFPGTFPSIESWEWRTRPDIRKYDVNHATKIGDNYFFTASDTTLNDVHVTTTHDPITSRAYDVSTDIYLSPGSMPDAEAVAAKLPATITRDMYAFARDGGIQYTIGSNTYESMSGSPMDKSDADIVYSNLQSKDATLASLIKKQPIGTVDFSTTDTNNSGIVWLDKSEMPSTSDPDAVTTGKSGYYLRMHTLYHYGTCPITNEIHGTVNVKQYNNAIHYAGTVSRPLQSCNLNVNYIDEDTNQPITGSSIANCETSKAYSETDLTSTSNPDGTNSLGAYYLPSAAPTGYTLDTSKYTNSKGYSVGFNEPSDLLPNNGWSSDNTASLNVYCKKPPSNAYTLNISYIDEATSQPISNVSGCETCKLYQESDLTMVTGGKVTYYLPTSAPSGYTLDTSKYFNATKGYGILFDDDDPTTLPHNGYSSNNIAGLQVYCKATAQKGTVIKRYFLDGVEQTSDEQTITDVPVGNQTYNCDKSYDGYICSNSSVTVNVLANSTVYADFKYTIIPTPVVEKGTVIKRYFLKGVEQTADEETIDDVETGSHTYSADKTYPRYTCENTSVTVNVTANSITYCDFNYGFENHPPTVTLEAPSEVVMGDDVNVNASGTDPDADPLTYDWNMPSDLKGSASGYTASGYFDSTGNKTYSVTVTDPYGASGSDSTVVKVVPPIPNAVIDKSGTEKENRKVTLDAEKYSSSGSKGRYTLDWTKAKWQFFDVSGNELSVDNNPTSSTIIKSLQSTTGTKSMDLIFKKAGKYTAKCTLYNTAGYSNSFSVDLNIVPDLAPTADFYFSDGNNVLRDPKDLSPNGLAQASHRLTDNSKSSDDNIGKRMWLACFDSDNDGSYETITNNEDGTKKAVPEKEKWFVYDLDYNGDDTRYKIQVPNSTPLSKLVTIGSDGNKYAYVNDSLNPHWRYIGTCEDMQKLDINKINCGNLTNVTFKSTSVGNFDFEEVVQESFGQDTIPGLITNNDIKQANTFNNQ